MKTSNLFQAGISIFKLMFGLNLILLATGCSKSNLEIIEKQVYCPAVDCQQLNPGDPTYQDPEHGTIYRGLINACKFTCKEPLIKGLYYQLVSFYKDSNGYIIGDGYNEYATEEGGVWAGRVHCEENSEGSQCTSTLLGDILYKGWKMVTVYDNGNTKLTITKPVDP